jgi:hypothetical protein
MFVRGGGSVAAVVVLTKERGERHTGLALGSGVVPGGSLRGGEAEPRTRTLPRRRDSGGGGNGRDTVVR